MSDVRSLVIGYLLLAAVYWLLVAGCSVRGRASAPAPFSRQDNAKMMQKYSEQCAKMMQILLLTTANLMHIAKSSCFLLYFPQIVQERGWLWN